MSGLFLLEMDRFINCATWWSGSDWICPIMGNSCIFHWETNVCFGDCLGNRCNLRRHHVYLLFCWYAEHVWNQWERKTNISEESTCKHSLYLPQTVSLGSSQKLQQQGCTHACEMQAHTCTCTFVFHGRVKSWACLSNWSHQSLFCCEGHQARALVAQRGSVLGGTQNQFGCGPGEQAPDGPAWAGGLDYGTSRGPFQAQTVCDCVILCVSKPFDELLVNWCKSAPKLLINVFLLIRNFSSFTKFLATGLILFLFVPVSAIFLILPEVSTVYKDIIGNQGHFKK